MVSYRMPNGELVPVPPEVLSQSNAAQQAFYDLQMERLKVESAVDAPAAPAEE